MPLHGTLQRYLGFSAAVFGLSAVVLAALGAHAVSFDTATNATTWRTASEIHLFHAAAMLAVAALAAGDQAVALSRTGLALGLGTLLFSGSLYLRAAGVQIFPTWIAPGGGVILIAAWAWLAVILLKKSSG